jgi:molecular chaperone IbpA
MVEGRTDQPAENDVTYLHRGIAKRAFRRNFRLADYVHVANAALKDGLLHVTLKRELPEEAKPRVIPINASENVIEQAEQAA